MVKKWCEPGEKDETFSVFGEEIFISFGTDGGNTAKGFRFYYDLIESQVDEAYLARKYKPRKVWKPKKRVRIVTTTTAVATPRVRATTPVPFVFDSALLEIKSKSWGFRREGNRVVSHSI